MSTPESHPDAGWFQVLASMADMRADLRVIDGKLTEIQGIVCENAEHPGVIGRFRQVEQEISGLRADLSAHTSVCSERRDGRVKRIRAVLAYAAGIIAAVASPVLAALAVQSVNKPTEAHSTPAMSREEAQQPTRPNTHINVKR